MIRSSSFSERARNDASDAASERTKWYLASGARDANSGLASSASSAVSQSKSIIRPTVGFFLRADVRRGTAAGAELVGDNELQSSIWNGNDITLWPGESETLTVSYNSADLQGATPVISVSGWNRPKIDIAAPAP